MSEILLGALANDPGYSPDLPVDTEVKKPGTGIWSWDNAQNGFHVTLVHFTSDPEKRTSAYIADAQRGISTSDFEREYNIRWESFKGKPVYSGEYKRGFHVSPNRLVAAAHLPIVRGWDFGLYPACIYAQLWPGMRLIILRELTERGMGLERFLEEVKIKTLEWFPDHRKFHDIVDPAGYARSSNDERAAVSMLTAEPYNYRPQPGIQTPTIRLNSVRKFLERNVKGEPALLLDPSCIMLIHGFDGGYHYQFSGSGQLREKPEKNEHSHPHDALQYIATRILDLDLSGTQGEIKIAQPSYGFNKANDIKEMRY